MYMEVSELLYYWRTRKNISVYRLSILSGVSENHIRNIENGKKQPTFKVLTRLTDGLKISLSEFFNVKDCHISHLSEGERRILEYYRRLPKDKADILIDFYDKMCLKG